MPTQSCKFLTLSVPMLLFSLIAAGPAPAQTTTTQTTTTTTVDPYGTAYPYYPPAPVYAPTVSSLGPYSVAGQSRRVARRTSRRHGAYD